MKIAALIAVSVLWLGSAASVFASGDDGGGKPRAVPAAAPKGVPMAPMGAPTGPPGNETAVVAPAVAPAAGPPAGLPADSTGVPAVASVPVGSDSDGGVDEDETPYVPPDPTEWVNQDIPSCVLMENEGGPRYSFNSWRREHMTEFMDGLREHGLLDQMMGLLEAVADGGVYSSFASLMQGTEASLRRTAARAEMNDALNDAREAFKERNALHGLSDEFLQKAWRTYRRGLVAHWERVIADGIRQFEHNFRNSYRMVMRGAACTCLAGGVRIGRGGRREGSNGGGGSRGEHSSGTGGDSGRGGHKRAAYLPVAPSRNREEDENMSDEDEEEEEETGDTVVPPAKKFRRDEGDDEDEGDAEAEASATE